MARWKERFTNEDQTHAFVSTAHVSPTLLGVPLTERTLLGPYIMFSADTKPISDSTGMGPFRESD